MTVQRAGPLCRGVQSRGIHPNSPAHHERVQVAGVTNWLHLYVVATQWDLRSEMSLSLPAKSTTPLSPACRHVRRARGQMHREQTYWGDRSDFY